MTWTKENCPYCGKDGKGWEWNMRGGQSYVKCNHEICDETIFAEESELETQIDKLQTQLAVVQKNIRNSNNLKG